MATTFLGEGYPDTNPCFHKLWHTSVAALDQFALDECAIDTNCLLAQFAAHSDSWARGMAVRQRRAHSHPLLPLLHPSSHNDSPCFIPEHNGRRQPAPLPDTADRSRSPLARLLRKRSPESQQRSATAEQAARRLAEQQAAQDSIRLASRLVALVAARDSAMDAAWLAVTAADRLAARVAHEEGHGDVYTLSCRWHPFRLQGDLHCRRQILSGSLNIS